MKKLLVLGLALCLVLSFTTMAFAVSVTPEVEGMVFAVGGAPAVVAGGAIINVTPKLGIRARAGYRVNTGGGLIALFGVIYSHPVTEKIDVNFGGGVNIYDSNTAGVTMGFGGQFYGGFTIKMTEKLGLFVDAGFFSRAQKVTALNATARGNNAGVAFGIKANLPSAE